MSSAGGIVGLFRAMLEAIHGSDDQIAGQLVTRLTAPLLAGDAAVLVNSTVGFGEVVDGTGNAKIVVGGEIIEATGRTLTSFTGLTRGVAKTKVLAVHHERALVYDQAKNTTALDLTRRGFVVGTALGTDLDVIGRNLGVEKCIGLTDDQWREVIKATAYLAKQPHNAFLDALEAIFDPSDFMVFERNISDPFKIFIEVATAVDTSLEGKFYLNSGEQHLVTVGGQVTVDYPILSSPLNGNAASGFIRVVSGAFLIDGENFVLSDGTNPAVTFEFDSNASVVETPTLRAVNFVAGDGELTIRDAVSAAITAAPTLDITPSAGAVGNNVTDLVNDNVGVAGNVTITSTVADSVWAVSGMSGGVDVGTIGVLGVYLATEAALLGDRTGVNLFTGGSFAGSLITLGTDPGTGVAVVVDYNSFEAFYLAPDAAFVNESDFPPYLSDNLLLARCIAEQIRAAGFSVELAPKL